MVRIICSFLVLAAGSWSFAQNVDPGKMQVEFFKEDVTMTVTDSTSAVSGVYYFRNNTEKDKPYTVMFPFHVDGGTQFPYEIRAYTVNGGDTLDIDVEVLDSLNAVRLGVPLKPKEVTVWHLDYIQRIGTDYARYILTTTSAWKKPLEEANFKFIIPTDFSIVEIWPKTQAVRRIIGKSEGEPARLELTSRQTDFMPNQDMRIVWDKK
jgi:hypothetical protein